MKTPTRLVRALFAPGLFGPGLFSSSLFVPALLALALAGGAAQAAITAISQVPVLNTDGSATVKPNLMLLYDNSGSMAQNFTPDYVDDSTSCRSRALMSSGTTSCVMGHPPFASTDFNRQYYNPKVLYTPPVYADGTSYPAQNSANTSKWLLVTTDGFGYNKTNMLNQSATKTDLVNGFPDKRWCVSGDTAGTGTCYVNGASYSYPNDTYFQAVDFGANPYYYTIQTAEYCTDKSLTKCVTVGVGAAKPAGYGEPAKVRWCNSNALTTCRAKYDLTYKYPRFGSAIGSAVGTTYGTITIGLSATAMPATIPQVLVHETAGDVVISFAGVTAANGTNSISKQSDMATDLALSIINKLGLTNKYTACVRTPSGTNAALVKACATGFGITLLTNDTVAVIPITCTPESAGKPAATCPVVTDSSRAGWSLAAPADVVVQPSTAILTVSGTTSGTTALSNLALGGNVLIATMAVAKTTSAATLANAIVARIGTAGTVRAYLGGNAITAACKAVSAPSVCLVDTVTVAANDAVTANSLPGITFGNVKSTGRLSDTSPVGTVSLSGYNSVFARTDIVATRNNYPRDPARLDCLGTSCTYAEEMTNFANWYAYYKTRNQMMKTALGLAFSPVTANVKVGIVALSDAAAETVGNFTKPAPFTVSARTTFYSKLYAMNGSNATPLRLALHAVGKMFSNIKPFDSFGVVDSPCQQNITFMTTDGYWNGGAPTAAEVPSLDETESVSGFCTRLGGCVDPNKQSINSLADIALYWYRGGPDRSPTYSGLSLRPELEDWINPGKVAGKPGDNTRLHMITYTLGLGVDGVMNYEPNYDSSPIPGGDYYNLTTAAASGCQWNGGGAYNWPDPLVTDTSSTVQSRVDDLWHAAVNGRGKYFAASDPTQVIAGLAEALNDIRAMLGSASSAATSSPNISLEDHDIFLNTFTTVKWYGELVQKSIDTTSGLVSSTSSWTSSASLGKRVAASSDSRVIKMLGSDADKLRDFKFENMIGDELTWFSNKCTALPQCASLSTADRTLANDGKNMVNWLRGQQQYANDAIFRAYTMTDDGVPRILGDIVTSKPAYLREPRKGYTMAGYNDFVLANKDREATVFVGANDGMLHAFNAKTGDERWAYVPRITMKKLYLQASTNYGSRHQFTVDGSPELADVMIDGVWKTILVGGLNAGGRGFYAIDVTVPNAPQGLWELCADSSLCDNADPELGLTFGNPQFGMYNGKWVVYLTSGYNNVPGTEGVNTGTGGGYLYIVDVATGKLVGPKIATGSGGLDTPSGLSKITAISADPFSDPVTTFIYGGDNLGQMWRFDMSKSPLAATKMGDAGALQPITSRPEVTSCKVTVETTVLVDDGTGSGAKVPKYATRDVAQRVVVFGTGRLLDGSDVPLNAVQSAYMIKDADIELKPWRAASMIAQTISAGAAVGSYTITNNLVDLSSPDVAGWYVDFKLNRGERVYIDPKIFSGSVVIVTSVPDIGESCRVGGTGNIYQLSACSGSFVESLDGDAAQKTKVVETTNPDGTIRRTKTVVNPSGGGVVGHRILDGAPVGLVIVELPTGSAVALVGKNPGVESDAIKRPSSIGTRKVGWHRLRN